MTSLIIQGKHLIPEGRSLILNLSYRMNNFRLSTSMAKNLPIVSDLEIKSLLTLPPLVQIDDEGRVREVKTGKVIREIYIVEVVHTDGKIEFFHSVVESAKSLNVPRTRVSNRLDDGKPLSSAGNDCKLRRIRVYFP